MSTTKQLIKKHTIRNFREIVSSVMCGCLNCHRMFEPSKIVEWDEHSSTAKCPYCEVKQVIGSASGYPITEEFLQHFCGQENKKSELKQIISKYRSSYSIPSIFEKSVTIQDINTKK